MKVHLYTDIDTLFGRASRLWMDVLVQAGHEVEFIDLGTSTEARLPDVGPCDVNLLVAGIYALPRFAKQGLPRHGKHALWMFDPLTRDASATVHRHKAGLFDAIAPGLHAVMAMDASMERYLAQHFPALTTFRLPYLVADKHVRAPLAEAQRTRDIIMLGGDTPRRREAERLFLTGSAPQSAEFIRGGLWGAARDACRAGARIGLNVHADNEHHYFDQFRTFETWAAGTAVVSDNFDGWEDFGMEPGVHLVIAELQDLPQACAELLADVSRREAMVRASQRLLRERFSPAVWQGRMLAMIEGIA
ncbi:glycosyltransferase [Polaromonas sp. YR568]|uniref:glycosyltransferase family protein n=1 Tax=Polaromonas sp. YR568 TaxID=1855301 RepID=UPI00398C0816